jgi:hypothetical protein
MKSQILIPILPSEVLAVSETAQQVLGDLPPISQYRKLWQVARKELNYVCMYIY